VEILNKLGDEDVDGRKMLQQILKEKGCEDKE
jgi:hypothetical protein